MGNEEPRVEITNEPKIESRFGYGNTSKAQSSVTVKVCAIATAVAITTLFAVRTPKQEEPEVQSIPSPADQSLTQHLEEYSAPFSKESADKEQTSAQKKKVRVIPKIAGIQKIERHPAGNIPAGMAAKSVLETGATDGAVQARTTEPIRFRGESLLPAGTLAIGKGSSSDDRLLIHFSKIVEPDGSAVKISADAVDASDSQAGLKGSKFGRAAMKFATSVGLNFVSGMAEGLQEKKAVGQQAVPKADVKNAFLHGTSKATLDAANDIIVNARNHPLPVQIPAKREFFLLFDGGE